MSVFSAIEKVLKNISAPRKKKKKKRKILQMNTWQRF